MTIPYNVSYHSMIKYIKENLNPVDPSYLKDDDFYDDKKVTVYSSNCSLCRPYVNDNDISMLVNCIYKIVYGKFEKIKKLCRYLKNIATILGALELPIV